MRFSTMDFCWRNKRNPFSCFTERIGFCHLKVIAVTSTGKVDRVFYMNAGVGENLGEVQSKTYEIK